MYQKENDPPITRGAREKLPFATVLECVEDINKIDISF